jgi:hypothetical protein
MTGSHYIARLPGCESPVGWYDRFPQLVAARDEQAEERSQIDLMIVLDNWKWMPVRQACRLVGRQDWDAMEHTRLLAQTQFGGRGASQRELNLPEGDDEEPEDRGGPMVTQEMLDQEERRDALQLECQMLKFCKEVKNQPLPGREQAKVEVQASTPYKSRGIVHVATKSILVAIHVIAMLTTSLANLPGAEWFKVYDCSNSSNPVDMYSLLDPEPCPDVALDHVVERVLHETGPDNQMSHSGVGPESVLRLAEQNGVREVPEVLGT